MTRASGALVGALDLLILRTLTSRGPLHGYAIAATIQQASTDTLRIEEGSLYPALHRMEKARWLKASWKTTENNRRGRVYTITATGKRQLDTAEKEWARIADGVARVLRTI